MSHYQNCTKEHPMPPDAPGSWAHEGACEVGEQEDSWPSGDLQRMECKDCGQRWTKELPQ